MAGPARIQSQLSLLGEVHYNADRTVQVVPRLAGLVGSGLPLERALTAVDRYL